MKTREAAIQIIFFDGHCNLCNHFVDFVLRRDKQGLFKIASLQGATAEKLLAPQLRESMNSLVLLQENVNSVESTAALKIFRQLPGWPSLIGYCGFVLPRPLRDAIYRFIAKHRYTLFGRRETCRVPTAQERARFLE